VAERFSDPVLMDGKKHQNFDPGQSPTKALFQELQAD
jgi:hypothetical protein